METVSEKFKWFILERNKLLNSNWNEKDCPACGGCHRIWFENFTNWTCVCDKGFSDPVYKEWWKHDVKIMHGWLETLIKRWDHEKLFSQLSSNQKHAYIKSLPPGFTMGDVPDIRAFINDHNLSHT